MSSFLKNLAYGAGLAALIACLALWLGRMPALASLGLSSLTLALILGAVLGNSLYPRWTSVCQTGVNWSKGPVLRWGIVLYGLRLSAHQVASVGASGLISAMLMVAGTMILAYAVGVRWLKLDAQAALLIGAGSGICGAAAVIATESMLKTDANKTTVAVTTVVVFGTLAIFIYPIMHAWRVWGLDDAHFGAYIGSSVHEVAQVVAAAGAINPTVSDAAVTVKMIRVLLLAPTLLALGFIMARQSSIRFSWRALPWFALGFIGAMLVHSLGWVPDAFMPALQQLDAFMLTMAMAALGLTTHWRALRQAGWRPLALAAVLMLWLVVGAGALQTLLQHI